MAHWHYKLLLLTERLDSCFNNSFDLENLQTLANNCQPNNTALTCDTAIKPEKGNNISFLILLVYPLETSSWYTASQPPNKQVRSCGFRCSRGECQRIKSEIETKCSGATKDICLLSRLMCCCFVSKKSSDTYKGWNPPTQVVRRGTLIVSRSINHHLLMKVIQNPLTWTTITFTHSLPNCFSQ